jgi:16S rRNA (cytidine1402-2'-O)-methyltransferase
VSNQADNPATLYLVATPIGNLGDISARAIETLQSVQLIAAEDTRHSRRLLQHFGINMRLMAYHEHNEEQQTPVLIGRLLKGQSIALISDAGTPLVSDPGYRLVQAALQENIKVVPIPGPCAAIVALSASGLPTDRFVFEGFPPAKSGARRNYLQTLQTEPRTLVFYVSCHRISETLNDMADIFGGERLAVLARELTKTFETIHKATLKELAEWVANDSNQQKGEIVLLVEGVSESADEQQELLGRLMPVLVNELPVKQAATIAAKITGLNKNDLYKQALALKTKDK